jgi:cytochrome c oxidase subunit 1
MTVVQPGLELTTGTNGHSTNGHARRPLGVFTRPQATTGWKSWLFTVDHKRIGIMYGAAALVFFLVGGCEALLIRINSRALTASCSLVRPTTRSTPCTASR